MPTTILPGYSSASGQGLLHRHRVGSRFAGRYGLHRVGRKIEHRLHQVAARQCHPEQSQAQAEERMDSVPSLCIAASVAAANRPVNAGQAVSA